MKIALRRTPQREPEKIRVRHLRVADRCDRCPAQAFALATVAGVDLLFCGHHFARHEARLRMVASRIVDDREWINPRPSPSANA